MQTAWHYTVWIRAAEILREGVIKPATADGPAAERPVVWFSLRQLWEPTANQQLQGADGKMTSLSFEQTIEHGLGGWRFGLPAAELAPWRELQAAGIGRDSLRALERAARRAGSDAALWLASLEPVKVERCIVQHLHGDHWHSPHHEDHE